MFSNPPHNLAAVALVAATLHSPATLRLTSEDMLVSKNTLLPSAAGSVRWNNIG